MGIPKGVSLSETWYYYRASDADRRVAAAWRGKAILSAADIEDLVAYLVTLKD